MLKLRDWIDKTKIDTYEWINPVIHIIEANPEKIVWVYLCDRPTDKRQKPDIIDWYFLSATPTAIPYLKKNLDKVNWNSLSRNPAAISILQQNQDKINWYLLSENPAAIHMLEANPEKIKWSNLCRNSAAIHILQQNTDKIDWSILSQNPAIYEYDYKNMTQPFTEELMANRFHPNNVDKFESWGF